MPVGTNNIQLTASPLQYCGFDGQVAAFFWIRHGHGTSNPATLNRKLWALGSANVDFPNPHVALPTQALPGTLWTNPTQRLSYTHSLHYYGVLTYSQITKGRLGPRPHVIDYLITIIIYNVTRRHEPDWYWRWLYSSRLAEEKEVCAVRSSYSTETWPPSSVFIWYIRKMPLLLDNGSLPT